MMSAKTVLTEAPATTALPAAPNNASGAAAGGGAPSDFQNLLAGAATPGLEAPTATPATQPLMELLALKSAQQAAQLAGAASGPATQPAKVSTPAVAAADLLKIFNDSTALLAQDPDAPAATESQDTETRDGDEPVVPDGDILADWLDVMLPSSVFAPQAGSMSAAGASVAVTGEGNAAPKPLPASLVQQAGLPELLDSMDTAAPLTQGAAGTITMHREVGATSTQAATQAAAAAFATALTTTSAEATEGEAPTNDSWMSAMGDLSSKRASDFAPASEARLPTPVHDARWADALAHRLVLMAREGESVASLKLVPVDLGPLDIQISVRDGEASVHFGAAHAETRAVLESSMPRLRELLSAQGLQLANASVSQQSGGQNRPERSTAVGSVNAAGEEIEAATAQVVSTSLLDVYV
jgi:flagellar hook-length control protein FliK